jgi:3-deoxy-D-manno-octulosonic-acid transferase
MTANAPGAQPVPRQPPPGEPLGARVRGALSSLLSWLAFGLATPLWLFHPRVRIGLRTRLGGYPPDLAPGPGPRVWLHGASAGDVLGLVPIIRELRALRPDAKILVTAMTDSGAAMAAQRLVPQGLADAATFVPWDVPGACAKAMRALRPDVLVLEYTELWPQLIRAAASSGAKLVLTNGRIGPRNVGRYRLLFWLVGNLLQRFELLLMRADDEAERALLLGATRASVKVTGNTKFDALAVSVPREPGPDPLLREALGCAGERLWVCGSTHEGEEGPLLEIYQRLRSEFPGLRLVLAPRYVERAGRLLELARARGLSARLRSAQGGAEEVIVLDTIGELVRVYTLATVVFVGGSFGRRGGQNVLEPAACGKPVLFGPRMENFVDSVQVLLGRGGLQVKSTAALERLLRDLLSRPGELEKLGEMARAATAAVRGASLRDAGLIASLLPPREQGGAR